MTKEIEFKEYAKDIKLNFASILKTDPESSLKENQIYGIALASSYATKNIDLVDYILERSNDSISDAEVNAAKSSATIMAMNNVYYRFLYLVSDQEYKKMPAKLRMNVLANPGIEKIDFELYAVAISIINNCGFCVDSHVKKLSNSGIDRYTIQHTIRIAAIINAASQTIFIN